MHQELRRIVRLGRHHRRGHGLQQRHQLVRLHVHLRRENRIDEAVVAVPRVGTPARGTRRNRRGSRRRPPGTPGLPRGELSRRPGPCVPARRSGVGRARVGGSMGRGRIGSRGGTFWEGIGRGGDSQLTSLFSSSPFLSSPYVILRAPFATTSHTDSRILSRWYRALGPGMGLASPGPMLLSLFLLALLS